MFLVVFPPLLSELVRCHVWTFQHSKYGILDNMNKNEINIEKMI